MRLRSQSNVTMSEANYIDESTTSRPTAIEGQRPRVPRRSPLMRQQECIIPILPNNQQQQQHQNILSRIPTQSGQASSTTAYQDDRLQSRLLPTLQQQERLIHVDIKQKVKKIISNNYKKFLYKKPKLDFVLLSLMVSFSLLGSIVLCDDTSFEDSREATNSQQYIYEQRRSISSTNNDDNIDKNHHHTPVSPLDSDHYNQRTDCPHQSTNSHKSQQNQRHHNHNHNNVRNSISSINSSSSSSSSSISSGSSRISGSHQDGLDRQHYQLDTDNREKQQRGPYDRSSLNKAREFKRTISGARNDNNDKTAINYQQKQQQHHQQQHQSSDPPTCDDCLAIPLVALVGDKQISGFIIPPPNIQRQATSHLSSNNHQRNQHRQQHQNEEGREEGNEETNYNRRPYNLGRNHHHYQQQQHQQTSSVYRTYGPAVSFEPKSDDKCPMTGPLTVCDHIGSYPTDVILGKLDSAKKQLGDSHFKLDSFFSDESENSGDPFEMRKSPPAPKTNSSHMIRSSQHKKEKSTGNASIASYSEYPANPNANIYSYFDATTADNKQRQQQQQQQQNRQPERRRTRANNMGYNSNPASRQNTWQIIGGSTQQEQRQQQQQQMMMIYPTSRSQTTTNRINRRPIHDEFVELVERQAISLSGSNDERYNDRKSMQDDKLMFATASSSIRPLAITETNQRSGLVIRTKSNETKTTTTAKKNTSGAAHSRIQIGSNTAGNYDGTLVVAQADSGQISHEVIEPHPGIAANSTVRLSAPIGSSNSTTRLAIPKKARRESSSTERDRQEVDTMVMKKKTRRSRRQVGSVRVTTSSGTRQQPTTTTTTTNVNSQPQRSSLMGDSDRDSADSNTDIDTDSENSSPSQASPSAQQDSDDNQAEPVCRVKSIYISPRAALNDKKQWKYVVNAPERNPQIRQIIRVDICQNPFGPCSDQVSIPFGFTSECKQKYSKKKLLALDAKSGLLEVDTFFIPSCCVCQLIRTNTNPIEDITASPLQADNETNPDADSPSMNATASSSSLAIAASGTITSTLSEAQVDEVN